MISEDLFRRGLRRLAFLLPESRVSTDLVDAYRQSLSDLTDDEWTRAVLWAQQNCRYFPRPVEIREAVGKPAVQEADAPPGRYPGTPMVLGVPLSEYLEAAKGGLELPEAAHLALLGSGPATLPDDVDRQNIVEMAAAGLKRMRE